MAADQDVGAVPSSAEAYPPCNRAYSLLPVRPLTART
jgi:hypothetical protein